MKIYSWNMLFRNTELDRAFDFIASSDFDVFCLQEVPTPFLERLRALPYHLAQRTDVERISQNETDIIHGVILSRNPFVQQGEVPFPEYWPYLKWRSRAFVRLMRPFGFSEIRNRGGLFVDLKINNAVIRVFNLHLILGHPNLRAHEFELAMINRNSAQPTVVCGDFNIIESRFTILLNWIFGGHWTDAVYRRRERAYIDQRFVAHELTNTLSGHVTHSFSKSQLDHILVSHSLQVNTAAVIEDSYGSDHQPIFAEIIM